MTGLGFSKENPKATTATFSPILEPMLEVAISNVFLKSTVHPGIGQTTILQDLQQHIEYVGVGFRISCRTAPL